MSGGVDHGFLLSGGIFAMIDFPGATSTDTFGINDSGQIVGRYVMNGVTHGFILSGDTFSTIDFPGSTFTQAIGINDSGQVVGEHMGAGVDLGFLATPVPEPYMLGLTAGGLAIVAAWNRRRQRRLSDPVRTQ